ncbi:MAG TPA: Holliday junction resolvase RuvX [Candidatus Acidoferrales bacterium]|nr:Holliday junction resolvase RuvX [Candidatus Acidoferrales bacterium]
MLLNDLGSNDERHKARKPAADTHVYNRCLSFHRPKSRIDPSPLEFSPGQASVTQSTPDSRREHPTGRVLGLDVGSRRIGIAVSDPLGITAQGLETLQRRNKRQDFAALERIVREYGVRQIVVGLPLRMSGAEGTQSDKMQVFAEDLRKRFRLPVHLWDERLTSAEANRLLRETELSIEKRAKAVDRMAAMLILQGWMESRGR